MMLELVVLVADKSIEQAIKGLLSRCESIGIRRLSRVEILVHPNRDPGVYGASHEMLGVYVGKAEHALIVLDLAWDGAPSNDPEKLESSIEDKCRKPWGGNARCVCIKPEIENWVWSDSQHVAKALGWDSLEELRTWLKEQGHWPCSSAKPPDPKKAFNAAISKKKVPLSASIFGSLAGRVSFKGCNDRAFIRLCEILRGWFPSESRGPSA